MMQVVRHLVMCLLLLIAAPLQAADEQTALVSVADWFKLDAATLEHWRPSLPDAQDVDQLLLQRRQDAAGPLQTVLVIYPRKSSAYDVAMNTLLENFAARPLNLQFLAVNFRNDPERGRRLIAQAQREKHALIYAMGSETVDWLYGAHRDIKIPVVTVCAKDPVQLGQMPDYETGSGSAFAFTSLNLQLDVQIEYLQELLPDLKNLAILVDARNVSAVETQSWPIMRALRGMGVNAFEVSVTEPEQARRQLHDLVPAALERMRASDPQLAHSAFWITGSTSVFAEIDAISQLAGKAPVLAVVPEVVRAGPGSAVLSIGVSFESNAQLAAVYGANILSGRSRPAEMKVGVVSPPDIAINFQRAREIGLKIPFGFFEAASYIYDAEGRPARLLGSSVAR